MTEMIKNFWKDEEGATAIEYGLIAGLIAVGIVVGATALGTDPVSYTHLTLPTILLV